MVAIIQRFTTIFMAFLAVGWAWFFAARYEPILAILGAVLIVFGYASFLAAEFVLLRWFGSEAASASPSVSDLFRAWIGEVFRTPSVFGWRQPFRSQAEPDHIDSAAQDPRRGVLLVHGFMCNRGFWNPWMKRLREIGVPFVAVSLERPFSSIDDSIPQIENAIRRLSAATGLPPVIVGHSMGGLAIRAWLATASSAERVHRVVTIASPHRGTWLARFFHGPNGVEMRLGSHWLEALAARESPQSLQRFICFYGPCDNIVFPISSATLPGADNRRLDATAHVQMAFRPTVFAAVLDLLRSPQDEPVRYPAPSPASQRSTG